MGEVYRARDTKLKRDVAIKILATRFANDTDRLERFQREAEILAALNHPNIGAIFGLEEIPGGAAIVLELVEGDTLADLVARGRIPVDEAIQIAHQIADALEAAHEKGVIHRDLKPANIKITPEGRVKVLDFGLAKILEAESALAAPPTSSAFGSSDSATQSIHGTYAGVIVGTVRYMSPEQARGRPLDRRSDVWAFGCVLYEMLTAQPAFYGATLADAISRVIGPPPDWSLLPSATPPLVRTLLRQCLQKDRKRRLQNIGDVRVLLDDAMNAPVETAPAESTPPPVRRQSLALAAIAGLVVGAAVVAALTLRTPASPPESRPVGRFAFDLNPAIDLSDPDAPVMALSPTGSHLVHLVKRDGVTQLYVRSLDSLTSLPIAGTEGASSPFFSPDGQWIGFLADGKLKKVRIGGGTATLLCDLGTIPNTDFLRGASWGTSGTIVFSPGPATGLWQVPGAGGTPAQLTTPASQEQNSHRWPELLPGDRAVVFAIDRAPSEWDNSQIVVQSLVTGERRELLRGATPRYLPTGHLVFSRSGTLMAVPFDVSTLQIREAPVPVVEGVMQGTRGLAHFSFSQRGSLAYVPGTLLKRESEIVWVDREGRGESLGAPPRAYFHPRLSPDASRIALEVEGTQAGVWVYELARGALSRFTVGDGWNAIWTPDGKRLTFEGGAARGRAIFWRSADGSGQDEQLTSTESRRNIPLSWTPDGTALSFVTEEGRLMIYRVADRNARPVFEAPFNLTSGMFSPDGRWLAYGSNETGQMEIYIQAYPDGGQKLQLSTGGGTEPMWARNGRELFYRRGDQMLAVPIQTTPALVVGRATVLFEQPYQRRAGVNRANYDVLADGRFLMIKTSGADIKSTGIRFVTEWFTELRQRMPGASSAAETGRD
jgi:serine/threonine protein kinase